MTDEHFKQVAEAFSYKSTLYDPFGEGHVNLARMRQKVYTCVENCLKPGDRILEINAGTGTDAAHFAALGYPVHAVDISPGMIAAIAVKAANASLGGRLTYQQGSFTDLAEVKNGPFQYIFSNFGGLNCISDLTTVTGLIPSLLVPGGILTWVIMPPFCPWDFALVFKGQFRQAFRRYARQGTIANVEGVHFRVNYFTPAQVLHALGSQFRPLSLEGLSVFTPTADRKNFALLYPRVYRILCRLDDALSAHPPFNHWGDFFILTVQYRANG